MRINVSMNNSRVELILTIYFISYFLLYLHDRLLITTIANATKAVYPEHKNIWQNLIHLFNLFWELKGVISWDEKDIQYA